MTTFQWRMTAAFGSIVVIFLGLLIYIGRVGPQMGRDSGVAINQFYTRCRAQDYEGAHALFSRQLKDSVSTAQLKAEWTKFGTKNGAFTRWQGTDDVDINGFGGSVCVFPPFVDFRHAVFGTKGTGTLIYTRMVPEDGTWRVERFNVLRYMAK